MKIDVKELRRIRNYFGDHDKTIFEHHAYSFLDSIIKDIEKQTLPKIICYCGSMRFWNEFIEYEMKSLENNIVPLLPCCMAVDIERVYGSTSDFKTKADEDHKRKIQIADEVHINNKYGYIGESTRNEIDYALSLGKPVIYLYNQTQEEKK